MFDRNVRSDLGNGYVGGLFADEHEYASELAKQAKTTATCRIAPLLQPYKKLSIAIQTRYRLFGIIPRCKAARFEGVVTQGSSYVWTPEGTYACSK